MTYFKWRSEYSVGVTKLDEQHKKLINMINELYEAMQANKGKEALGQVLAELVAYTETHFADEESLMREYEYAELSAHLHQLTIDPSLTSADPGP